jgi:hypothetical protein
MPRNPAYFKGALFTGSGPVKDTLGAEILPPRKREPSAMNHSTLKRLLLTGLLTLLGCQTAAHAVPPLAKDTRLALDYLASDIRKIALEGGSWEAQRDRERQLAEAVRQRLKASPGDTMLSLPDKDGMFPLAHAALNGFALVVEALLESPAVRAQVNTVSLAGAPPLALAQLARPLTFWACDPNLLNVQLPEVVEVGRQRETYYAAAPDKPFERIQQLLADAGATLGNGELERSWRKLCPASTSEASESLFAAAAPTEALVAMAERRWARHQRVQARKASAASEHVSLSGDGIPAAVRQIPAPIAASVPNVFMDVWSGNRVCRARAEPEIGLAWPWAGTASVRAVVTLQGGLPVSVNVRRVGGDMSPSADPSLGWLVSRALTLTECRGETRYEIGFDFKVAP